MSKLLKLICKTKTGKQSCLLIAALVCVAASPIAVGTLEAQEFQREYVEDIVEIPIARYEVITREPSNEHVWIKGSWEWENDEWEWVSGQWVKPPSADARWAKGHWSRHGGKWHWKKAHWISTAEKGYIVEKMVDLPRALSEKVSEKIANTDYWIPGGWEWDGRWVWVKGRWAKKPGAYTAWVPGHWNSYGTGGYRWTPGHWVRRT